LYETLIRQDLQGYQDFLGLVNQYFVHPVDSAKKGCGLFSSFVHPVDSAKKGCGLFSST
jgi:hypothetical protein